MLLKRTKTFFLLTVYTVFLFILLSESFLSDFQEIRRNVLIELEDEKTATLFIPKSIWNSFSDKGEFEYQGDYYDTKSFVCQNNTVKVEVIPDSFELVLKTIIKATHSTDKKDLSSKEKKKIELYLSKITSVDLFQNNAEFHSYYDFPFLFPNKYFYSLFRPPVFV